MAGQQIDIVANLLMKVDGAEAGINKLKNSLSKLKMPEGLENSFKKSFANLDVIFARYRSQVEKGFSTKADVTNFAKTGKALDAELDRISKHFTELTGKQVDFKVNSAEITKTEQELTKLINQRNELAKNSIKFEITGAKEGFKDIESLLTKLKEAAGNTKTGQYASGALDFLKQGDLQSALVLLDKASVSCKRFSDEKQKAFANDTGFNMSTAIKKIVDELTGAEGKFGNVNVEVTKLEQILADLRTGQIKDAGELAKRLADDMLEAGTAAKQADGAMQDFAQSSFNMAQQLGQLQQSTQYFFSLRNMINLLKRGISEAVQTVKDLDKAMTETAVVTDFSVGDMWAKLPEYTANANKLGATIQDMYESTTLYYQQGLNTQQAMSIATETMKMARIAGLKAKDATDMMTAALRGFNMELNDSSATRINDVYSNLAAKTASDTKEIGTAMQRTASIAHSAGMSFEGTAAFLAQAIETTREPAENIGTAMKTIVARFQEMKKNPLEIAEVDGEEVSYNKVDAALQSIGVSLKDTNGQFRELDKVFLDISKKWDGLSQTQQRYIATIAAGSRQQSRFIAMMSDYNRTVELMSYANDSTGASQEQFNKTLDSLEAKLNKFQNAWKEFLMGIMNDSWVKGIVDAGTKVLSTVNSIIDALSGGGRLKGLKSLLSISTAGIALKAGGNLINKLIGGVSGFIDPTSNFGKGFWGAGKTTAEGGSATGLAGKITTPIVAKLNELIAVTRKNKEGLLPKTTSTLDQYKNASAMLRNTKTLNMGDIKTIFDNLSDEHAYAAYKNTPGTADAMKQAALGWFGSKKMPADAQKTGQQLMNAIFKGMSKKEVSIKDGMKLMGKPALWGEYFGTDVAKNFSQQYIKQFKAQVPQMREKTQVALQQTWQQLLGSNANNKTMQQGFLASQIGKDKFISAYKNNRASLGLDQEAINNIPVVQDNVQQLANKVGILGSRFSAAGMSLQMFGAQLGQLSPALQGIGTLLSHVGMAINTFGMGISGMGPVIGRFSAATNAAKAASAAGLTAKTTANVFLGTLTEGLSAGAIGGILGVALIGGIAIVKGILDKKAREAGEEVRQNFEKGFTETNKKIESISDYKDRFNELSKGVDQFGHNINLTDEEFDEYLTINRELQELSPSLIAGYNAEGQAILRKGAALDEVIDKLKQERDLSLQDYITNDSIQKLIGEYNISDAYKNHNTVAKGDSGARDAFTSEKSTISKAIKKAELEWSDFSQILDELGIGGAESIYDLSNRQLSMISDHYIDIINKIKEFNPQIEEEAEEGLKEAFATTNNALEDVLTEGAPIIDALHQWMGQEKLDAVGLGLSEEFVSGFNSGLDGLMLEGLTNNWKPEEYKTQLREYASEWEHLAGPTSTYSTILAEADEIQQQYLDHIGEDGAIENYENDVEGLATQLESLAEQYKGTGAAGEIFAEQCQQQANNLRNYATEGVVSLSEALNTLSDEFSSARGAQERFQKATESGDYYTAAEGYKSIIETMLDEKNTVGNGSDGSLTFWAGADELLGQKFVDNHTANEVVKQVEKIKGCFEDGLPGVQKFGDLLVENADKLKGLGEINEDTGQFEFNFKNLDDLEQYAELLGISEDALAALIDKSRQYVPWNLSDPGEIRKAIEDSQYSMAGVSTKGENLVYISESQFRAEARQQGIRGDDYIKTKNDAEERGVRFLNVENLTAKNGEGLYADQVLENIGLKGQDKTVENAVAAFTKMGLDLEDTKQVLMSDGIKLADGEEATAENIEKAYNEQAYEMKNPTVAGIASDTSTLVSNTSAMLATMGILTEDAKKEIDQATNEDTTQGYIDNLQNASSLNERNTARTTMEDKVSEYNALANKLVEAGRSETDPYVQKLRDAAEALQTELNAEAKNWNDKAVAANQYLKENNIIPQSATTEEQQAIQMHAVDLQSAIETGDANTVIETLKQIETEGNLSIETMIALGQSVNDLGAVDSSSILHFISEYYEKLKLAKEQSNQPFEIETKFTGEKLEDHISAVKEFTAQEYAFLIRADVSGDEKVSTLINSINQEFGNGDQETKTILIDAVAKTASGDKEGAHNILAEAFGEDTAETIEKKIDVLCDGSVANKDEVIEALENELKGITLDSDVKVNATASVDSLKTTGGTVHYSTEVNTDGIKEAAATANNTTGTIKIDGDNKKAKSAADAAKTYADKKTGKITIDAVKGSGWNGAGWSIHVSAHKRGRNYSIPAHQSLSFGAAAEGLNIFKKRRHSSEEITSLVGEEGFEIGYIPSEQRSVIFGVNGPEMTAFPKDTIIYPHSQSKKILQRGKGSHKSFNSFADGNTGSSGGIPTSGGGGKGKTTKKKSSKSSSKKSKDKNKGTINNFSIQEVVRFNIDKNLTTLTNQIEDRTKTIEKTLAKIGTRYKDIVDNTKKQVAALSEVKNKNQALYNSYAAQLNEWRGQKEKVSYTDSKGKSHDKTINVASYVNADGSINQAAIAKLKTREEREAVFKAVSGPAKTLTDGMNNALKAMDDAQQKIDDLGKKISEAFYQWENELTEVYDLTQRINNEVSFTNRFTSQIELELAKLGAGFGEAATAIENTRKVLTRNNQTIKDQIANQQQMIAARQRELNAALSFQDEINKRQKFEQKTDWGSTAEKNATIEWAKELEKAAMLGSQYVKNVFKDIDGSIQYEIDWEKFNSDNEVNPYSKDTYESIKKYLDDLNNAATEFNNSIKEQTDFIKETYDALREYQDYVSDMEDTLIKGVEEQIEEAKNNAKQLSDSITGSLKDLLDEVKRKLDERRKQEDNAKTERDISQKQQRLAALRADTSSGHQVEIAQLEKEIADAQQSYQRTLEDQLLDRLQQQADEAAAQRERQIELMEAGNQIDASTNKELVDSWLHNPEQFKEQIRNAWLEAQGYDEKGEAGQYILENEFESAFTQLVTAVEQSGFDNVEDIFTATADNTDTLVHLVTELNNNLIGRDDELTHSINAQTDATDRNTESLLTPGDQKYSVKELKERKVDANTLRQLGYTAKDLIGDDPNNPIYSVNEMKAGGYTAAKIKEGGISTVNQFKEGGFTVEDLQNEFSFSDLLANFTPQEMAKVFNENNFKTNEVGYATALQAFGNSDESLRKLSNAGYTEAGAELTKRNNDRIKAEAEEKKRINTAAYNNYMAARKKAKSLNEKQIDELIRLGGLIGKGPRTVLNEIVGGKGADPFTWENIMKPLLKSDSVSRWNLAATYGSGSTAVKKLFEHLGINTKKEKEAFWEEYTRRNPKPLAYKTGGLADYTGPAWLDGTPSKPELVLNAKDTKNFLALRDVLSSAMKSTGAVNNSYSGDAMYEININVDHLNNDYDVDKVAERVKKIIVKDAGYRNVTQVRNLR